VAVCDRGKVSRSLSFLASPTDLLNSFWPLKQFEPKVKLHSPVKVENIAEKLWKQHKVRLTPEQILLPAPITKLGAYKVAVKLQEDDKGEPLFLNLDLQVLVFLHCCFIFDHRDLSLGNQSQ